MLKCLYPDGPRTKQLAELPKRFSDDAYGKTGGNINLLEV